MLSSMDWNEWQSVFVMLAAIIIERTVPIPRNYHPLTLIGFLLSAIERKVNIAGRSEQQHRIAGALAVIVVFVFLFILAGALQFILIEPIIFELCILIFLLRWDKIKTLNVTVSELQKRAISDQLADKILRETTDLSLMGSHKAAIENLSLRIAYQWFAVIFWYTATGIWGALSYRLLQLMAHHWNCKLFRYQAFGKLASRLFNLLSAPSNYLLSLTLCLFSRPFRTFSISHKQAKQWHHYPVGLLLSVLANSLSIQLGGPRKYQGTIQRYPQLGTSTAPSAPHIRQAQKRLVFAAVLWCLIIVGFRFIGTVIL